MPTTTSVRTATIPLIFLLGGCIAPKGNLGEYTASEASSGETDTSGSEGTSATGGSVGTTSAGTTSAGTTNATSETDGVPLDPNCEEPAQPSWEYAIFSFDPQLAGPNFAGECDVTDVELHPGGNNIGLDCGDEKVQIDVTLDEPLQPQISVGDVLVLDYRSVLSFGTSEWFTLRRPDADATLVLAGVVAEKLEPPETVLFFAPLALAMHLDVCPKPITCDDATEAIAVEFTHEDNITEVFPQYNAVFGQLSVFRASVSIARKHYPELPDGQGGFCSVTDIPPYQFRMMIQNFRTADEGRTDGEE